MSKSIITNQINKINIYLHKNLQNKKRVYLQRLLFMLRLNKDYFERRFESMKPNPKEVGQRIYQIRTKLGYSMEDFGKVLHNVSRASVNNWEKGKSVPKKDKLEKMSLISGYTVAEILYGDFSTYIYELVVNKLGIQISDSLKYRITDTVIDQDLDFKNEAEILTIVTSVLETYNSNNEADMLEYLRIAKNEELYLALSNQGNEVKAYMYLDKEREVFHLAPFSFTDMSLVKYLDFLMTSDLSHYVTTNLKKFKMGEYPKIVLYSLKVVEVPTLVPITREQIYYLKYNKKMKAYEYELDKEKKLAFGTHEPFMRELLKEKYYRQNEEEKAKKSTKMS